MPLEADPRTSTAEDDRYRLLVEAITDYAIYMLDPAGVVTSWNPGAERFKGYRSDEIVGRHFSVFYTDEDRATGLPAEALGVAAREGRFEREGWRVRKDGERFWANVVIDPIRDPSGSLLGFAKVTRDLTERKEAERALADSQSALFQSQKMEAVGHLTGGIAHDFNNLLASISGNLELLETRLKQGRLDTLPRHIDAARGAARRAAVLTQRLLAFSRRQTLDPKAIVANRLIANMEDLLRRSIGPNVSMDVVGAIGLWPTLVDPNQLENALLNLCINARAAMPDGGKITIETANKWLDDRAARERDLPPAQYISICVSDTGTGMTPEVAARAFDPFFTTKPIGEGTGLGLSMIHGFVRQSGGQVRIYSEVGLGTTMCLYLPRFHGDAQAEDVNAPSTHSYDGGHGETVLIIDDEPTVRMLISDVLQDAGYRIREAEDGPEGLTILRSSERIDLLITDVGLPGGMNGRQVADAARTMRPDLKVLFVTGYAENAVVANGQLEPGMQILTKPFAVESLGEKVREILDGRGSPAEG